MKISFKNAKNQKQLIKNLHLVGKLIYKGNNIRSEKIDIAKLKDDVRKTDEKFQQLYSRIKLALYRTGT